MNAASAAGRCANCRHLCQDARDLEAEFPGLRVLSSAYAAVRSDDGLCRVHGRYVASSARCAKHEPR
jgi:hypothetical protein